MPVTTFLNEDEKKKFTVVRDKDVNELLQEIRKIDDRYYLQERIRLKKRLFRKTIIDKVYVLYFDYARDSKWDIQIMNLGHDSKEVVMSYFYGFLAGKNR